MRKLSTLLSLALLLAIVDTWLTNKDTLSVGVTTWHYDAPLSTHYNASHGATEESQPHYAHSWGIGLAYQRYMWKGLYSVLHALPQAQQHMNEEKKKTQNGPRYFLFESRLHFCFKF